VTRKRRPRSPAADPRPVAEPPAPAPPDAGPELLATGPYLIHRVPQTIPVDGVPTTVVVEHVRCAPSPSGRGLG
jgi:hypothetical protein